MSFNLTPPTRAAGVTNELRRLILSGELTSGQRLRQAEIAERFGVSTTPVREAFTALAREGLVRQDPHRGVVVFEPRLSDLKEYYDIRGELEPLATELATPRLTDKQVSDLTKIVSKMRSEKDLLRYQALNRSFHGSIYAAADRPRLVSLIDEFRDASESYLRLQAAHHVDDAYQAQVHEEHEAILAALKAQDAAEARELMAAHLRHNRQHMEATLWDEAPGHAVTS